jgi:phospholipid-translocating ATPase
MKISNEEDIEKAQFSIESEAPHANLYSYNGVLKYRVADEIVGMEHPITEGRDLKMGGEKTEPISINELLLRGCALRNTKWVICMVLFTGTSLSVLLWLRAHVN